MASTMLLLDQAEKTIAATSIRGQNGNIIYRPDACFMRDYGDRLGLGGNFQWASELNLKGPSSMCKSLMTQDQLLLLYFKKKRHMHSMIQVQQNCRFAQRSVYMHGVCTKGEEDSCYPGKFRNVVAKAMKKDTKISISLPKLWK